ncbi:hypothetical protein JB92DRAFT_3129088 [Gautieria morchelliformis]|nr:hypothetical protein JB92DRAFT_3129088 [Gautieria morchelliformis]
MCPQETIPLPAPVPPLELMRESNPFPPDPYGKPPPSLKIAALRRDWCRLTADAREAFWKEHLAGEESETEPESDSSLTNPSKLLQTKIAHAAPVEEDTSYDFDNAMSDPGSPGTLGGEAVGGRGKVNAGEEGRRGE